MRVTPSSGAPSVRHRRVLTLVALGGLLAGGLLAYRLLASVQGSRSDTQTDFEHVDSSPGADPTLAPRLRGSTPPPPSRPASPGGDTDTWAVRIRSSRTGRNLAGAAAALYRLPSAGYVLETDLVVRQLADEHGVAQVPVGRLDDRGIAVLAAPGYVAVEMQVSSESAGDLPLEVALRDLGSVTGRITGKDGQPVSGLTVVGVDAAMDFADVDRGIAKTPMQSSSQTVTDADGSYRLQLLSEGAHRVSVRSDGWIQEGPPPLAAPGDRGIDFVVQAVRAFRVRLEDSRARFPVSALHPAFIVIDEQVPRSARGRVHHASLPTGSDTLDTLTLRDPPGVYTGVVRFAGPATVRSGVRVLVSEIPGYSPAATTVTLRLPSELRESRALDIVPLTRLGGARGRLLVQESSATLENFWTPSWRLLRYRHEGAWTFVLGSPSGDFWAFEGVHAGANQFTVDCGVSRTLPFSAEVEEGNTARVLAEYGPVQGVSIALKSSSGAPLNGATVYISSQGKGRGAGDSTRAKPWLGRPHANELLYVQPLDPGSYVLRISKLGFEPTKVEVEVLPGEVSALDATLKAASR